MRVVCKWSVNVMVTSGGWCVRGGIGGQTMEVICPSHPLCCVSLDCHWHTTAIVLLQMWLIKKQTIPVTSKKTSRNFYRCVQYTMYSPVMDLLFFVGSQGACAPLNRNHQKKFW